MRLPLFVSLRGYRPGWLRGELAREGVTLLLARDIGQVRDVLRVTRATDGGTRPVFPTVEAAVEAATRSGDAGATEST